MIHRTDNVYFAGTMTEIQCMDAIISYLTGLDSRITCDTTTAVQYADSSNTATFNFSIDGKYVFEVKRQYDNSSSCRGWFFTLVVNGVHMTSCYVTLWRYAGYPTSLIDEPHNLIVESCIGENEILLWMQADYRSERFNTALVEDPDSDDCFAGYSASSSAYVSLLYGSFYRCSDAASGYTFPKMINFTAPAGHISYSTIAPMTCNGVLTLYAKDILSCSTVPRGSSIALPNGINYYAIETNHMIKLDI